MAIHLTGVMGTVMLIRRVKNKMKKHINKKPKQTTYLYPVGCKKLFGGRRVAKYREVLGYIKFLNIFDYEKDNQNI